MLTEEKLPVQLKDLDCKSGCATAVYRTVIKRDGVVIHTEYDYQYLKVDDISSDLAALESKVEAAIAAKIAEEEAAVVARQEAQQQTLNEV